MMRFPALGEHVGHDDDRDGCICGCPDEAHEMVGDEEEGVSCAAHPGSWCIWAPLSVGAVIREMRAELDRLQRDVEAQATGMRVLCEEREAALVRADQNEAGAEHASRYVAELQAQLATYDEAVKIEHACAVKSLDREYAFKEATARELARLRELRDATLAMEDVESYMCFGDESCSTEARDPEAPGDPCNKHTAQANAISERLSAAISACRGDPSNVPARSRRRGIDTP